MKSIFNFICGTGPNAVLAIEDMKRHIHHFVGDDLYDIRSHCITVELSISPIAGGGVEQRYLSCAMVVILAKPLIEMPS